MEPTSSTALGDWLQRQLDRRQLSQMTAAARLGVGVGTISQILRKGHIPKLDTLFRLADFFDAPREYVLHLAAGLPQSAEARPEDRDEDEAMIRELLREFRRVPDEWKPVVIEQVELIRRLAEKPPLRIIGGEHDDEEEEHEAQASPPQEA
jgi:transcriptional regulator with XRE-family HTH domain